MVRKLCLLCFVFLMAVFSVAAVVGISGWQQVNVNGFGDTFADEVSAVADFNGYLYAGTVNATNRARIFRSLDGVMWNPVVAPGFGSDHDTAPPAILDLAVFNGRLYASTGGGDAAQIWRTLNGTNWTRVVNAGFGDPDIVDITALTEFNGQLYAAASHAVSGAQIWRSFNGDSNSWTQVAPAVPGNGADRVTGMGVFDGALYAAVTFEAETAVHIWRSYGGDWTIIVDDGFGNSRTTQSGGMVAFDGYLYVGAGNQANGAQLWRTADGARWEQLIPPGFGDSNNTAVTSVIVFQNTLYVSVNNEVTGLEIWRWTASATWELVNQDGFGDSHNTGTNGSNATAIWGNDLYMGTQNTTDGGELWRMQSPTVAPDWHVYLPLIQGR